MNARYTRPFTTSTHIIAKCQLRAPASQPPKVSAAGNRLVLERIAAEGLALARERGVRVEDPQSAADHDRQRDDVDPMRDANDGVMPLRFMPVCRIPGRTPSKREHDRRDHDVHPVALQRERDERERHARHRRRDQQHEPELHDRVAVDGERAANDAAERPQRSRLAAEDVR